MSILGLLGEEHIFAVPKYFLQYILKVCADLI